jgi:hypothetical protein
MTRKKHTVDLSEDELAELAELESFVSSDDHRADDDATNFLTSGEG